MKQPAFYPGQVWPDADGKPIESHLGGIFHEDGTYYWYGMNLNGETIKPQTYPKQRFSWMINKGMTCYSSKDLHHWKLESVSALPVEDDPTHPLQPLHWMLRPKVLKCAATGTFVMMAQTRLIYLDGRPHERRKRRTHRRLE